MEEILGECEIIRRMLVIDEDQTSCDLHYLAFCENIDVITKTCPKDAEGYLSTHSVDVIITELSFSHVDGLALLTRLANRALSPPPLIVVVTTIDDDDVIRSAFRKGASEYFVKPYNVVILNTLINNLIDKLPHDRTM